MLQAFCKMLARHSAALGCCCNHLRCFLCSIAFMEHHPDMKDAQKPIKALDFTPISSHFQQLQRLADKIVAGLAGLTGLTLLHWRCLLRHHHGAWKFIGPKLPQLKAKLLQCTTGSTDGLQLEATSTGSVRIPRVFPARGCKNHKIMRSMPTGPNTGWLT